MRHIKEDYPPIDSQLCVQDEKDGEYVLYALYFSVLHPSEEGKAGHVIERRESLAQTIVDKIEPASNDVQQEGCDFVILEEEAPAPK